MGHSKWSLLTLKIGPKDVFSQLLSSKWALKYYPTSHVWPIFMCKTDENHYKSDQNVTNLCKFSLSRGINDTQNVHNLMPFS